MDILLHLVVDLRHQDERRRLLKTVAESDKKINKIVGATWVSCVSAADKVSCIEGSFAQLERRHLGRLDQLLA